MQKTDFLKSPITQVTVTSESECQETSVLIGLKGKGTGWAQVSFS